MDTVTAVVDQYFAGWNETDAAQRRELIAQTWTDTARYLDPMLQGEGHAGIDAMIQGVQERFAGHRFRRTGPVDVHHDQLRCAWELAPADGPAIVTGTDFGVVAPDGRLQTMTGFFDQVPGSAAS